MHNMIQQELDLINQRIGLMTVGAQAGLVSIFGDHWQQLIKRHDPRNFGKAFKAAVATNHIAGVKWVRIENSGRFDVYEKI